MSVQTLVTEKKYRGKFVALFSFSDKKVVSSGKNPAAVMARAHKQGATSPVIVFIPEEKTVHVF